MIVVVFVVVVVVFVVVVVVVAVVFVFVDESMVRRRRRIRSSKGSHRSGIGFDGMMRTVTETGLVIVVRVDCLLLFLTNAKGIGCRGEYRWCIPENVIITIVVIIIIVFVIDDRTTFIRCKRQVRYMIPFHFGQEFNRQLLW